MSQVWSQSYTLFGSGLAFSAVIASLPILILLFLLGVLRKPAWIASLFGIFPTRKPELEVAIQTARRQASLSKRILFLSRTRQVFNLWHVVHRPFSYSFAILAILHIVVALGLGYR